MNEIETSILTCLIEGSLVFFIVKKKKWPCRGGPLHAALAQMATVGITHPQAWLGYHTLMPLWGAVPAFVFVELLVFIAKVPMFAWMTELPVRRAAPLVFIVNATSALGPNVVAAIIGFIWGITRALLG